MKSLTIFTLILLVVSGCSTTTGTGAVTGGAAGGVLGAIIGHQSGHGGEGAAIGAATGAIAGAVIGNKMEEKKFCPVCGKQYPATTQYCPDDGTELKIVQ
jgi:uncharacterized protein YcfJ